MGFVLGNELNNEISRQNILLWEFLDSIAKSVKEIAPNKLTMTSTVDDGMLTIDYVTKFNINGNIILKEKERKKN